MAFYIVITWFIIYYFILTYLYEFKNRIFAISHNLKHEDLCTAKVGMFRYNL